MKDAATTFPPAERIVKPRTRAYKRLPVVAISGDHFLAESGETGTVQQIIGTLPDASSTLFAKLSAADFIAQLDDTYSKSHPDHWQWRARTHERDIIRPDGFKVAARLSVIIHYFGWKGGNFHRIVDPVSMYGHKFDNIWPGDDPLLVRMLQWATTLRDFCHDNGIEVRPTTGGISAQFLTDRRFYPNARRKVPMAINERAREVLPGNHYTLRVVPSPHREFTAHYLDQHRAHHYHARTTTFPDADHLYAYGHFVDLKEIAFSELSPGFHGLYCLDLEPPSHKRPSHWIIKHKRAFVFSNELEHLVDMGYKVNGVYAAWGSHGHDTGLGRYAQWATQQLDHYGDEPWIKPLLLSAYGTLATRPRYAETVFRLAKRGEPITIPTGHKRIHGQLVKASKKLEPRIANVIHRGMIEAATRSESVGFGQYLASNGWHVLSVYADAVIIKDDCERELPSLPEPWRCKTPLNHLQFIHQQAFISGEMTRLPGVGQELRQYRQETSPGYAPRKVVHEAGTNRAILTDRRI